MATALKLKRDINKLKAAIRSKATPQSYVPKLKAQLQKAEADYESVKAGKKSAPKASKQVKSTMDKLKAIIKKKKYGAYRAQGVDLKKDADRPALRSGKRISKNGNTYYEYRANRIDVKQPPKRYPKLEDGGMMAEGGFFDKKEDVVFKFQEGEKIKVLQYSGGKLKPLEATIYKQYAAEQPDGTYYPFYWTVGSWEDFEEGKKHPSLYAEDELIDRHKNKPKMADGGMMAKGGYMAKGGGVGAKEYKLVPMIPYGVKGYLEADYKNTIRFKGTQDEATLKAKELAASNPNFVRVEIKREMKTKTVTVGIVDGQNTNYAGGGYMEDGGLIAYANDDYENKLSNFTSLDSAKKFAKANKYKYDTITFEDESGDTIVVSKDDTFKDIDWLFSNKMAKGGYMEDGGTIDNSGMTPADLQKQIWNLTARIAKLGDIESRAASDEIEMLMKQRKKLQSMALNHGDVVMAQGGELHRSQEEKFKYGGYMAEGGKIKDQYEGREPEDIWNNLSKMQRSHFIFDHASEIEARRGEDKGELKGKEISDAIKKDFDDIDIYIRVTFENHVREGQYKYGGYMAKGGEVEIEGDEYRNGGKMPKITSNEEVKKYAEFYIKELGSVEEVNKEISKTIRDLSDDDAMSSVNQLRFFVQILLYLRYEHKSNQK